MLTNNGVWIPFELCDKCGTVNGVAPLFTLDEAVHIIPFAKKSDFETWLNRHKEQFLPTRKIRKHHGTRIRLFSREELFLIRTMLTMPYSRTGRPPQDVRIRLMRMSENLQREDAERYPAEQYIDRTAKEAPPDSFRNQMLAYLRGETDEEPSPTPAEKAPDTPQDSAAALNIVTIGDVAFVFDLRKQTLSVVSRELQDGMTTPVSVSDLWSLGNFFTSQAHKLDKALTEAEDALNGNARSAAALETQLTPDTNANADREGESR
jgi:hypothetical protein